MTKFLCGVLLLVVSLASVLCEVIIVSSDAPLYDISPKLKIQGTGFADTKEAILLKIGTSERTLKVDVDYTVSKDADDDGLVVRLVPNKKWADLTSDTPTATLMLSSVMFGASSKKNLLLDPVKVATVIAVPKVTSSAAELTSTTPELRITGTGLIGAKSAQLYFKPNIAASSYEDVSEYPLKSNTITLKLTEGSVWTTASGPLLAIGIDTGAGPAKLNGGDGVVVATIKGTSSESPAKEEKSTKAESKADTSDTKSASSSTESKSTPVSSTTTTVSATTDSSAVFADTIAILQKKIVKYTTLLDAADSVEESVKIADLLVKLSTTLNNIN